MRDINALKLFRDVASAGGYSAAHRKSGKSRATLSRNIAALEEELGTRLIERSTRSFRLTESGRLLYERASDILSQLDEAVALVEGRQHEPRGRVRIAVPPSLLHLGLGEAILQYLDATPQVEVQLEVSNRQVDIRHEGFDFVLRARTRLDYPLDFVPVPLARMELTLVVHPKWTDSVRETLEETLKVVPTIGWAGTAGLGHWHMVATDGEPREVAFTPRLLVDDITTMRQAVLNGMGLAVIPRIYVDDDIRLRRLIEPDMDLSPPTSIVHAVHLGQRGMRPAVRHLLDWLKNTTRHLR